MYTYIYMNANVNTQSHTLQVTAHVHESQPLLQQGHLVLLDEKTKMAEQQNVKSADKLVAAVICPFNGLSDLVYLT